MNFISSLWIILSDELTRYNYQGYIISFISVWVYRFIDVTVNKYKCFDDIWLYFFFPFGLHVMACLVIADAGFRSVWLIHPIVSFWCDPQHSDGVFSPTSRCYFGVWPANTEDSSQNVITKGQYILGGGGSCPPCL